MKLNKGAALPKLIDLGFALITIEYANAQKMREEYECEDPEEPTPEGIWDSEHDTIWILKQRSKRKMRQCILHELVHAALDLRDGDVR